MELVGMYYQPYNFMFSSSVFSSYVDWFHSFNCSLLFGVLVFVVFLFFYLIFGQFYFKSKKIEYQFREFLCRILPTLILVVQMVPSLALLYLYGLINIDSELTVKVTGHQWYWSYDYRDIPNLSFDSYMKSLDELKLGEPRLFEVDNRCVLPEGVNVRFCITSADVIHSWALPSMSIKVDAMRGVLNTLCYVFPVLGVFYGQCSEICGVGHSFMPIALEVTLLDNFKSWSILNV